MIVHHKIILKIRFPNHGGVSKLEAKSFTAIFQKRWKRENVGA
jgi:hypothetical protein